MQAQVVFEIVYHIRRSCSGSQRIEQMAELKQGVERGSNSLGNTGETNDTRNAAQKHETHAYADCDQEFPSTRQDTDKRVVFQEGENDSET